MSGPNDAEDSVEGEQVLVTDTSATDPETLTEDFLTFLRLLAKQREGSRREQGWAWDGNEALVLHMAGSPTVVPALSLPPGVKPGRVKECYYNAFTLASSPGYTYAEGWAMAGFFPVHHAWVVEDATGNIVDPTWVNLDYEGPFAYLGLRFSQRFLLRVAGSGDGSPSVFEADWTRKCRTARCGLVLDGDGLVVDWADPPEAPTTPTPTEA